MRTTFLYRDLTERERAEIADSSFDTLQADENNGERIRSLRGTLTRAVLGFALTGTKVGFPLWAQREGAEEGELIEVPFAKDGADRVHDAWLRLIPWDVQVELADAILMNAVLDAHEVGKLALSRILRVTADSPAAPTSAGALEEGSTKGPSQKPETSAAMDSPSTLSDPESDEP